MTAPAPPATATLALTGAPQCHMAGGAAWPLGAPDALLLAWLALEGPTPRERLAALLWPESPADAARNALRQRLFRLKRQTGLELVAGTQLLALAAGVHHDLAGPDAAPELLAALPADAAAGELADWLAHQRQARRGGERQRLLTRIEALETDGDPQAALPLAEQLLAQDALSEEAHRRLMRLHYLAGDRAAALRAFDRCEQQLKHELGTRPSAATLALLATIEAAEDTTAAPAAPTRHTPLPAALMRPPRLVGRDTELARLATAMSRGGRLVVTGEAGMGKSRLLQAAATGTSAPLLAAGRPGDPLAPYATLGRALRELRRRLPDALEAAAPQALAPALPELADAHPPRGPRPEASASLVSALQAVFRRAQDALGGVLLDDLHFADDATLQLLPELLGGPGAPAGAWVLSMRPPEPGSAQARLIDALAAAGPLEPLALAPLDEAALAALVDLLGLPGVRGTDLAPVLRARSGGNPLFALETLKLAWGEGCLAPGAELPRPASVGQLIERSLQGLSPEALLLARLAAVAGVDFGIALAESVLQRNALQLADAWAQLEQHQVLRGSDFAHDLVHERVLAGIPEVLARHTHATVAQWLQAQGGEPARIAAHWEAAGQPERALPALRAAAERAHDALREPERIAFLVRAADIAEHSGHADEGFELLGQAVEAHMNAIREASGFALLERLDRLARTPLQKVQALNRRAWYATNLGDWPAAEAAGRDGLAALAAMAEPAEAGDRAEIDELRAVLHQRLGTTLSMSGRFDEALPLLHAAEPWVEANAGSDSAAEFHGNLAAVLDNLGRVDEARERHARVIAATQALGDHSFHATALANFAVNRLNAGDARGAQEPLQRAQQVVTTFELLGSSAGFIAALQGQAARALGDYAAALQWCTQADAVLTVANPAWLPLVAVQEAQVWLDLGQPARAQQRLQAAASPALPARIAARRALLWGRLQRLLGQPAAARTAFDEALALAPVQGWPELRLSIRLERAALLPPAEAAAEWQAVAELAARLGLRGLRLAALLRGAPLDEAVPALAAEVAPGPLYLGEVWLAPARALAAAGRHDAARTLAEQGWAWAQATAASRVPEAFVDGFLHRQPDNLALVTLARHGVTPA